MATITKENIGLLHEKISVTLAKTDYLPTFEKALKDYSKKANIPGFRKGMVPSGLIKKMYGPSLFTDEVLRSVDRELIGYLQTEKLDIFAQPLPLEADIHQMDVNNPLDYTFHFEIGLRPDFPLPDLAGASTTRYVVEVTDEMINNELTRLQNRYGNMKDEDVATTEEHVLNVLFTEVNEDGNPIEGGVVKDNSLLVSYFKKDFRPNLIGKALNDFFIVQLDKAFGEKELEWILGDLGLNKDSEEDAKKHFKIQITKIGLLEKRELNEEFFNQLYPDQSVKSEADFRNKIKEEIAAHWNGQAMNQLHDQAYHILVDKTEIPLPEIFLKKWMQQGQDPETGKQLEKTPEEVEDEFPKFSSQLKWTLISDKIVAENEIHVGREELKDFAKQQLFSYMQGANFGDDQPWLNDYLEKMMQDRKYMEDAHNRIQTQKIFDWTATQLKPTDKSIGADEFNKMVEEHQHHLH